MYNLRCVRVYSTELLKWNKIFFTNRSGTWADFGKPKKYIWVRLFALVSWGHNFSADGAIQAHRGFCWTPRTGLLYGLKRFIIFNPLLSPNMTPWRCRTTVFYKHSQDQLVNDKFSTNLNKTGAIWKVIKFTRMCFLVFSKSVQVPLRSVKKILLHFKISILYI